MKYIKLVLAATMALLLSGCIAEVDGPDAASADAEDVGEVEQGSVCSGDSKFQVVWPEAGVYIHKRQDPAERLLVKTKNQYVTGPYDYAVAANGYYWIQLRVYSVPAPNNTGWMRAGALVFVGCT